MKISLITLMLICFHSNYARAEDAIDIRRCDNIQQQQTKNACEGALIHELAKKRDSLVAQIEPKADNDTHINARDVKSVYDIESMWETLAKAECDRYVYTPGGGTIDSHMFAKCYIPRLSKRIDWLNAVNSCKGNIEHLDDSGLCPGYLAFCKKYGIAQDSETCQQRILF